MRQHWRIAIAGEGGQGVQLIGEVLAEAAFAAGKEALYIPNFGWSSAVVYPSLWCR